MSRKYYTPPPTQGDIPAFLKKAYMADHLRDLIQWASMEQDRGLQHLSRHASPKAIQFFIREYSPMRILAESEAFQDAIGFIDAQNYAKLSGRERVFVRRAYELFRALSG